MFAIAVHATEVLSCVHSGGNRGVVHVVRQVAALRGPNHSYIEL